MSQELPPAPDAFDDLDAFFAESPAAAATSVAPSVSEPADAGRGPHRGHGVAPESVSADGRSLVDILTTLEDGAIDSTLIGSAAATAGQAKDSAITTRVVAFTAGGTTYGVRVPEIIEIGRIPAITPVPQLPAWVRGVTNLRGDVVSVIDLAALCGMDPMSLNAGRMLVARQDEDDLTVGILVERVHEIATVTPGDIRQPTAPLDGPLAPFMRGVCQRDEQVIVMLDLAALLRSSDVRQFEDVHDGAVGPFVKSGG